MTFLEALYGSQYYEIKQQGKDGNKGRLNGNLFLSVMVILFIFTVILLCVSFLPGFDSSLNKVVRNIFGYSLSGKTIGKIIAIPVLVIVYIIISRTVGSVENFKLRTDAFMQYPDEIKKKANTKLLAPFFILLTVFLVMVFSKM